MIATVNPYPDQNPVGSHEKQFDTCHEVKAIPRTREQELDRNAVVEAVAKILLSKYPELSLEECRKQAETEYDIL